MPEIQAGALTSLLLALSRATDLGAIAANTYVAPAGMSREGLPGALPVAPARIGAPTTPGAGALAPGLLADPLADPQAALSEPRNAEAAPDATAGRSLVGLRPPRPVSDGATAFPALAGRASLAGFAPAESDGETLIPAGMPGPGRAGALPAGGPSGSGPVSTEPGPEPAPVRSAEIWPAGPRPFFDAAGRSPGQRASQDCRTDEPVGCDAVGGPAAEADGPPAWAEAGPPRVPEAAREGSLAAAMGLAALDGRSPPIGIAADQQLERAGIIASFILNAAMIPGWPPPQPFAPPAPEAILATLLRAPGSPEAGIEEQLRQRGARRALLARMRALLARLTRSRRIQVMLGLTILLGAIAAIEAELGDLARGGAADDDEASRRRLRV